jgi:hypothetical protein
MTLDSCKILSASGRKRTERNTLIELHIIADHGRFTDYDTCAVVDEEILSNHSASVDIDTCFAMRVFRHDARNHRDILLIQDMRDTVYENGEKSGIRNDNLRLAL